jgi:hypothetical protein
MADNTTNLRGTVHIQVTPNVTLEHLNSIVSTIGGLCGCRTCGILGIDLRISGDPVESQQIASLPGVKSVSFGA